MMRMNDERERRKERGEILNLGTGLIRPKISGLKSKCHFYFR